MSKPFQFPSFSSSDATAETWLDYTKRVLRGVKIRSVKEGDVGAVIHTAADSVAKMNSAYPSLLKLVRWSRAGNLLGSVNPRNGITPAEGLSTLETTFLFRPEYNAPHSEWVAYHERVAQYLNTTKKPREALCWVYIRNLATYASTTNADEAKSLYETGVDTLGGDFSESLHGNHTTLTN